MVEKYGVIGSFKLLISWIYTRIFFRKARIIRLPFDIRNKRFIDLGKGLTTGFGCRLEAFPIKQTNQKCLVLGNNVEINDYVHIAVGEKIEIGDNVLIASKVFISDINHGTYTGILCDSPLTSPNDRTLSSKPIIIGNNVWIGEGVCILSGVTIGSGCVIGAGAIVTKSIPSNSIAVGSPAKVVKTYSFDQKAWLNV